MLPRTCLTLFLALLVAQILAACSLQAPVTPSLPPTDVLYTAAAQTVIAQLTQMAPLTTNTPPLPDTPAATATPAPSQAPSPTIVPHSPTPTASPEATLAATVEPSPTLAATATATTPPADPKAALGNARFTDTFTDDANWSLYQDDHVSFKVKDESLVMTAFNPDSWEGWTLTWPDISDFYLEMTATPQGCTGRDRYGLVFRSEKNEDQQYLGYFFGISCDGRYSLRRWDGEAFVTLVNWTASEHLLSGEGHTNRIGVLAKGDQLSLYANGYLLTETTDETHAKGKFGVFIGSVKTTDFKTAVDDIAYWDLP
jgi:hypothetical protein